MLLLLFIINLFLLFLLLALYCQYKKTLNRKIKQEVRLKYQYTILKDWIIDIQTGRNILIKLERKEIHSVAVYGMGDIGRVLCDVLTDSIIDLKYGIDKNNKIVYRDLPIYTPSDDLEPVDIVINTAYIECNELEKLIKYPIVSIETLLHDEFNG